MIEQVDSLWEQSEHLNYRDRGILRKGAKTRVVEVMSRHTGASLGFVRWYSNWRQYSFYPAQALFNKDCLREIADYCEHKNKQHRELRPYVIKTWQEKRRLDKLSGKLVI